MLCCRVHCFFARTRAYLESPFHFDCASAFLLPSLARPRDSAALSSQCTAPVCTTVCAVFTVRSMYTLRYGYEHVTRTRSRSRVLVCAREPSRALVCARVGACECACAHTDVMACVLCVHGCYCHDVAPPFTSGHGRPSVRALLLSSDPALPIARPLGFPSNLRLAAPGRLALS